MLWTVNVGKGYGGPVVKDGKVYLLDRDDELALPTCGLPPIAQPLIESTPLVNTSRERLSHYHRSHSKVGSDQINIVLKRIF